MSATEGTGKVGRRRVAAIIAAAVCVSAASLIPASPAYAERVADCNFNLDWPHKSRHQPDKVTSNGVITCRSPKAYLGVEVFLDPKPGHGVFYFAENKDNSGRGKYIAAAAAGPCRTADYDARAEFLMVEHNGTRHERSHRTPVVHVTC